MYSATTGKTPRSGAYAVNFKVLLISACTYLAMARAVKFYQNYHNHILN